MSLSLPIRNLFGRNLRLFRHPFQPLPKILQHNNRNGFLFSGSNSNSRTSQRQPCLSSVTANYLLVHFFSEIDPARVWIMTRTKKAAQAAKAAKRSAQTETDSDAAANVNVEEENAKATKKEGKGKAKKAANQPKGKGKKRASEDGSAGDSSDAPKPKMAKTPSISDSLGDTDFTVSSKSSSGKDANFKIASWNINGVRAWLAKEGPSYIKSENPDVLCIQELKCDISKIPSELAVEGYSTHWLSGDTEGYSGVGMYFKNKPISITEGIGIKKHDNEGRVLTAEYEKFYLVNTYIPNSGRGLVRHKYRTTEWDTDFLEYLKTLDKKKPVIWCGDLNVAHQKIDIKNASGNKKNAGFTQEERDNFSAVLEAGFIDSFRHLYPEQEHAYSFWSYFMNARGKNVGWRLDYFVISERLKENLCDSALRTKVMGSDHCPVVLELAI